MDPGPAGMDVIHAAEESKQGADAGGIKRKQPAASSDGVKHFADVVTVLRRTASVRMLLAKYVASYRQFSYFIFRTDVWPCCALDQANRAIQHEHCRSTVQPVRLSTRWTSVRSMDGFEI